MNRTLLYLILFMASMTLQAQTEYGLLINTDLEPRTEREQTQGSYDIFFLGNSLNLFPNGTYQPISQTDFFYATPDPVTKRIDFSCFSMHQDCYIEKNTFIETNGPQYVTFFSGCFASSSILLLHLTNTSSKTSYCVNETINFENGFNWRLGGSVAKSLCGRPIFRRTCCHRCRCWRWLVPEMADRPWR